MEYGWVSLASLVGDLKEQPIVPRAIRTGETNNHFSQNINGLFNMKMLISFGKRQARAFFFQDC
jgi:hypothetical protein